MKIKWYDLIAISALVFLTGMWLFTILFAAFHDWRVLALFNEYNEGWPELIGLTLCFVFGLKTCIKVWRIYKGQENR